VQSVGELGVSMGERVCAVCWRDWCEYGGESVCCVWESLVWVWGSECVLCVGEIGVSMGE